MDPVLDRLAGDELDFTTFNSNVRQLTLGESAQLGNGVAVCTPFLKIADEVHFKSRLSVRLFKSPNNPNIVGIQIGLNNRVCIAALRIVHCNINNCSLVRQS
jgi:hypothetical protein